MTKTPHVGPFVIDEGIGMGGMGTVFRAVHRHTGVPVAVKVVDRVDEPRARRRFRREVQSHAGLLHPGIVYLFEYGEVPEAAARLRENLVRGAPYVAMELARGGTLRGRLPFDNWNDVRGVLVAVLDALAYAHARRVVHLDVKPENVLVFDNAREEQAPPRYKLADFGIAHAFDREFELDTDSLNTSAGTAAYMAPEQVRANWRDYGPWSDLYALGCMAWELICGDCPFEGNTPFAVAAQHESARRPPLEPQFAVPADLEDWVHRMMAVRPEDRFRRAADAAHALPDLETEEPSPDREPRAGLEPDTSGGEETRVRALAPTLGRTIDAAPPTFPETGGPASNDGERTGAAVERPEPPADWRPERRDSLPAPLVGTGLGLFGLRDPPFVDRETEGDRIWRALREVDGGGGTRCILVEGEAGTGKSRLAEWIATRAHELGAARVVRAHHTETGGAREGLRGALDQTLRTLDLSRRQVYEHLLEKLSGTAELSERELEREVRALTEFLRPSEDGGSVEGPRYRFASREQRRALVTRTLGRLGRQRPVIVQLEDLQWGPETLGVLEHVREQERTALDILVLATLRPGAVAGNPLRRRRIDALRADAATNELSVGTLDESDLTAVLEGLLPLEPELATRVARGTNGHPLFAIQLLDHWVECGGLAAGADGFSAAEGRTLEIPDDIHDLWLARMERLFDAIPDRRARLAESLEVAAALGREVDHEEWQTVLERAGLPEHEELVDRLADRGLAERTRRGWRFTHGLFVGALAERARRGGRWQLHHRRCAEMLAERSTGGEFGARERLADHLVAAGELERAVEPLLDELRAAGRRAADDDAERLLAKRGDVLDRLEVPAGGRRRLEQEFVAAQLEIQSGELREAVSRLEDVWRRAAGEDRTLRSEAALRLAEAMMRLGEREEAREWAERAEESSREAGDARLRSRCHRVLSWFLLSAGDLEEAGRHARRATELVADEDADYEQLTALRLRALVRQNRGDGDAGELFEELRRRAAEAGFELLEAQASVGLGEAARFDGRLDEARNHYRRYLESVRRLSRPKSVSEGELNLAMVELAAENTLRARGHLEAAEQVLDDIGGLEAREGLLISIRLGLAAVDGKRGRFDELLESLGDRWSDDWRLYGDHPWLLERAGLWARGRGWDDGARRLLELARDLWRELGDDRAAEAVASRLGT